MIKGWWELKFRGVDELNDVDTEIIGNLIKDGFREGEIIQDDKEEKNES